ncbi:MAG: TlpA family protein disulfide reductase, partial [Chloroflexi bacterium]|nr:TlpA family protein disulfide reductase [Chloroflexota bacterium]
MLGGLDGFYDRNGTSDYDGQVVVMNMWATWCPPCRAEMPELNRFYETHKNEGLV